MSTPDFYTTLADHYDELFATSEEGLDFLRATAGTANSRVLDVACGTGAWLRHLVGSGLDVYGVDLAPRMIERGQVLADQAGVDPARLAVGDMMEIDHHPKSPFGLVYCLGNSVSHLRSHEDIKVFAQGAARAVDAAGTLVLQYVNVDRLAVGESMQLPPLATNQLTMRRTYHRVSAEEIEFTATLAASDLRRHTVTQRLLVMRDEAIRAALTNAGFQGIQVYGGFDRSPVSADGWVRVTVGTRGSEHTASQ